VQVAEPAGEFGVPCPDRTLGVGFAHVATVGHRTRIFGPEVVLANTCVGLKLPANCCRLGLWRHRRQGWRWRGRRGWRGLTTTPFHRSVVEGIVPRHHRAARKPPPPSPTPRFALLLRGAVGCSERILLPEPGRWRPRKASEVVSFCRSNQEPSKRVFVRVAGAARFLPPAAIVALAGSTAADFNHSEPFFLRSGNRCPCCRDSVSEEFWVTIHSRWLVCGTFWVTTHSQGLVCGKFGSQSTQSGWFAVRFGVPNPTRRPHQIAAKRRDSSSKGGDSAI
jgi:hypothetical protein